MYNGMLLGGGKNYSIESILQKNLKIATEFSGSSHIQAKHTNNFFELGLKDLDLPSMAHLGVVVTTLPAPILNLAGKDTPRGVPKQSDSEKSFDEMTTNLFKDRGLEKKSQNRLSSIYDPDRSYGTSLLNGLTTDYTAEKLQSRRQFSSNYKEIKLAAIKTEYSDGFGADLIEFEAFMKTFVEHLGNFSSLVEKLHEIPQK